MAGYRDRIEEFNALGTRLLGISVDSQKACAKMVAEQGLPFALLSDADRVVVTKWGLLNKHERGGIAYPATWVLGPGRLVRYRSLDRLASRVDPGPVLAFLKGKEAAPSTPKRSIILPDPGTTARTAAALLKGVFKKAPK